MSASSDDTVPDTRGTASPGQLARGTSIGRYLVLEPIGRGGVGVVYAAFDPELDRRVAIKVMQPGASEARGRMLREAQAMARLAHPNVVAVHDVGTHDGQVFVAMELVAGVTLRRWIADAPRSWRDVRDMFVQAARGLEAAHAADLIHRDFKPDNVLVGNDGRARVLDFGLARAATYAPIERPSVVELDRTPALDEALTEEGAFLGTPAYMAPEQHQLAATTARTDQFSFCVALYEAWFGVRPFAGDTLAVLGASVIAGEVRPVPDSSPVPLAMREAVLRGLRSEPHLRWPTMTALIGALSDPPAKRRRLIVPLAAGTVAAAAIAGIVGYRLRSTAADEVESNLDFEQGAVGGPPPIWRSTGAQGAHEFRVVDAGCRAGRCAQLSATPAAAAADPYLLGDISLGIPAERWLGKRIRIRASARTEGTRAAIPWIRVDRPGQVSGFAYDLGDHPVRAAGWTDYELVAYVSADALAVQTGVVQLGGGLTWLDSARIDEPPSEVAASAPDALALPANLGFEAGTASWTVPGWASATGITVTASDRDPAEGAACVELVQAGAPRDEAQIVLRQRIDARALRGKHITVRAFTRSESRASLALLLSARTLANGVEIETGSPAPAAGPGEWWTHTAELDVPVDADQLGIQFIGTAFSTASIDGVEITTR